MRFLFLVAVHIFLTLSTSFALGTLSTKDLLENLRPSNPALVTFLETEFDLNKEAEAATIGRAVNPQLAGTRVGPYTISASVRGVTPSTRFNITLNTKATFLDRRRNATTKLALATKIEERLESITIAPENP